MSIRMIVTDLDRTLLRSDKTISDYTIRVLSQCRQKGIRMAFATARSENSSKAFMGRVNPDSVISNGGALVRSRGRIVRRTAMGEDLVNRLLSECVNSKHTGYITVDTDKGYFVNKPVDENDPGWVEYLPAYPINFLDGLGCDAYKLSVEISDRETAFKIAAKFQEIDVTEFSGESWYRYALRSACKWEGVRALMEDEAIDVTQIACFGDDFSDLEMVRNCGFGVAVSNAIDDVKAAAGFICESNDNDGVAGWIEENILGEKKFPNEKHVRK